MSTAQRSRSAQERVDRGAELEPHRRTGTTYVSDDELNEAKQVAEMARMTAAARARHQAKREAERQPWDRLPAEPLKWFERFERYRLLPPATRSVAAVYQQETGTNRYAQIRGGGIGHAGGTGVNGPRPGMPRNATSGEQRTRKPTERPSRSTGITRSSCHRWRSITPCGYWQRRLPGCRRWR